MTRETIQITAKDNKGEVRNLSILGWNKETGKSEYYIRLHHALKQGGARITNRMVVGLDDCKLSESDKAIKLVSEKDKLIRAHLARSLV